VAKGQEGEWPESGVGVGKGVCPSKKIDILALKSSVLLRVESYLNVAIKSKVVA